MSLSALTLGAAVMMSPLPPPRPAQAPDPDLRALLAEVRRISGVASPQTAATGLAGREDPAQAARPDDGAADRAPRHAPVPLRRGEGQGRLTPNAAFPLLPDAADAVRFAVLGPMPTPFIIPAQGAAPAAAPRPPRRRTAGAARPSEDNRQAPAMGAPPAPLALSRTQKHVICEDPRLAGTAIPAVAHATLACGIAQPVRVTAIAGIRLSTPATLDCNTASRFASWLTGIADIAAREHLGSGLDRVWVMGSYACRTRNNRPGGKLSEHARGRAIDIGGVRLKDGRRITLLDNWGKGAAGRFLSQVRGRACGLFRTVLGPGSDGHHADHFHFDTSPRKGRAYCR